MDDDRAAASALSDPALGGLVDASALDHAARLAVGVSGQSDVGRYGRAVGRRGRWAVLGLSGLSFASALPALFVLLVGPVVAGELGKNASDARWAVVAAEGIVALAALVAPALTRDRRHGVAVVAAINAGLVAVVVARLDSLPARLVLFAVGAALVSIGLVVLRPLLVDVAPPEVRVRALARWRGAAVLGASGAAALAALALGGPEWGWRTALTVAGGIAVALGLAASLVDDPGVGGFEARRLARLGDGPVADEDEPRRPMARALGSRVVRRTFVGYLGVGLAGLGSLAATATVIQADDLTAPESYLGLALAWAVAALAVLVLARPLERLRRRSPGRLAVAAPILLLAAAGGLVAIGLSTDAAVALVGAGVVAAGAALAATVLDCTALSAVTPHVRPAASALTAVAVALGAIAGLVWFAVPEHADVTGDLVAWLAAPVAGCALLLGWLPRAAVRALDDQSSAVALRSAVDEPGPPEPRGPDPSAAPTAADAQSHVLVVAGDPAYSGRHRGTAEDDRVTEPEAVPEAVPLPVPEPEPAVEGAADVAADVATDPEPGLELTVRLVPTVADAPEPPQASANGQGPEIPVPRSAPPGHSVLAARAVSVAYGSVPVLVDVDLRLAEGEAVALVAPSGVSRSALLRVLSGAGPPSSGQVLLDGEDVSVPPVFPRPPLDLAEIVRGRPLLGSMTVAENLRMYGFTVGHDKAEVDASTVAAFEVFPELTERRDQLASTLSGADRQRVALARSIMARPQVLLVEPESLWLRPVVAAELATVLTRLRAGGTGLLLVAESSDALPLPVDRAYLLARGHLAEQPLPPVADPPAEDR